MLKPFFFCNKAWCTDGPFHLDCYRRYRISTCLCRLDCNQSQIRMEMVTMGPYDVSDTWLTETLRKKRVTKNVFPLNSGPPGYIL